MKTTVSKSVRKAAVRFAVLVKQLVSVDGNLEQWETRYRKSWGRRKVDALLGDAQNALDLVARHLVAGRKQAHALENSRWTSAIDSPWYHGDNANLNALLDLRTAFSVFVNKARERFIAAGEYESKLFDYAKCYALRSLEIAFNTRRNWLESRGYNAEDDLFEVLDGSNVEEVAPAEEAAPVEEAASLQAVVDAGRRVDGPAAVPAYGAPSDAFAKSVKAIIISSALVRFSNVIIRLQSSRTPAELAAVVLDACREVQSVEGWERYKEASIIDDEAERFTNELKASCDDAEKFPRLQLIAEKIAAAFGSFAIKALAAA